MFKITYIYTTTIELKILNLVEIFTFVMIDYINDRFYFFFIPIIIFR